MINILLTGSSGFIGGYFRAKFDKKYNIKTFSFLKDNFSKLNLKNINVVLHLSALVHQKTKYTYEKYYEINVNYPIKLAKLAKQNGINQFVFMSSIAVYGENEKYLNENTTCTPVTPYGKSKLEAEKQLLELNDENFTVSIIRPPMVYGKNAPGNIDSLVKLVRKIPIIPLGGIKNKRSFIYIGNLSHLINAVIEQNKSGIFLASDDEPLSTTRLCRLIAKNLDKKAYLVKIPLFESLLKLVKPSFHKRLYGNLEVDNHKTKQILALKNPHSVEEGIRLMINHSTK